MLRRDGMEAELHLASGVYSACLLGNRPVTEDFDQPQRPRHMVMWWARRFSAPLQQTFPTDLDTSDQLIELLEQAERRIAAEKPSS